MTSVNGQLVVAGGRNFSVCAWYNPATNTWCQGQQPRVRHNYGCLVHCADKVLLLGGAAFENIAELSLDNRSWSVRDIKVPGKLKLYFAVMLDIPQD